MARHGHGGSDHGGAHTGGRHSGGTHSGGSNSGDSDSGGSRHKSKGGGGDSGGDSGQGGQPGGQGGSTGPGGYDDGGSIAEALKPPEDTSGDDVQDLIKDAGVEVRAVEWVYQKFTGTTLTQQFIEPLTGDFSKMTADAEAWRNISESMKAFSAVMVANEGVLGESWTGLAATAHKAYVDLGWRAGLTAEAGIAELIAKGFDLLADTSKKLAAKALDLLKSLIDRLLVMAAEACVPIAGWIADAITALSELLPLINALLSIIDMIKDIIQKVGDLWNSIKDIGSQLAKIKDIHSIGDAVDIAKGIGGDVKSIKDDAGDIAKSAGDIKDTAKEGVEESDKKHEENENRRNARESANGRSSDNPDGPENRTPVRSGSGRISGRIDD